MQCLNLLIICYQLRKYGSNNNNRATVISTFDNHTLYEIQASKQAYYCTCSPQLGATQHMFPTKTTQKCDLCCLMGVRSNDVVKTYKWFISHKLKCVYCYESCFIAQLKKH